MFAFGSTLIKAIGPVSSNLDISQMILHPKIHSDYFTEVEHRSFDDTFGLKAFVVCHFEKILGKHETFLFNV